MQSFSMQVQERVHHVNFCSLVREDGNIFHSQSTVKTLESASQLPYRHIARLLFYFPRALKIRWIFAQRGPKWNGEWSTAEK